MCFLCERAAAQRLGLIGEASVSAGMELSTDPVPNQALISNAAAQFSKQLVVADWVMDVYLHAPGGAIEVSGGGFGRQTIQSVPITEQDQDYIRSIVNRLDSIIDLDFTFVGDAAQADTAFYYDQDIDVGGGGAGETLGLAVAGSVGWELFVNYPEVSNNWDYRQYVNVHEWGHSLGLEHPFEAGDGDTYNGNTDPWTSAYPEQTVMAYRNPESGDWPDFFTTSDLNALIEIWGAEARFLQNSGGSFIGESYKEKIYGGDGADLIIGNEGFDEIFGGPGDDLIRGGKNQDKLKGGLGNDTIYSGRGHDIIYGGAGDDIITGGLGNDSFCVSPGFDTIKDYNLGDKLILNSNYDYQFIEEGAGLRVMSSLGTTLLENFSFAELSLKSDIEYIENPHLYFLN